MIAHNPLHRFGRAELPHPTPTLGVHAQAHKRIRMTNASRRKPPLDDTRRAAPRQMVTLIATAQHRPPQITHCFAERAQSRSIHRHSVISEVTQQDRAQICSLFPDGRVHASPQFLSQGPQLGLPPLPHRLSQHREGPLPGFAAAMRKSLPRRGRTRRFAFSRHAAGGQTARDPGTPCDGGFPPRRRHPEVPAAYAAGHVFHGSIPDLYVPLSTLRRRPREQLRMTRGRCGSLFLQRMKLSFTTPCRF
jgi:hypothetical protein